MPQYFGHKGIVQVRTDSVGVHQLPYGWILVTGDAAPAAAGGTKNLSGKARCKISTVASVEKKYLEGFLANKISITRCSLTVNGVSGVTLDGVLLSTISASCDLYIAPRAKELAGNMYNVISASGTVFVPGRMEAKLRCRMENNATLYIGKHRILAASVANKISATASLTTNYMRIHMQLPITARCYLSVNHKFSGNCVLHQTASLDLQNLRTFGGSADLRMAASARLDVPPRASAVLRMTASMALDVRRYLRGDTTGHISATASLDVNRTLKGTATLQQTTSLEIEAIRSFIMKFPLKATASASLESERRLRSILLCHWTATMNLQVTPPVIPPVGAELFVAPDMDPTALDRGATQVEEEMSEAQVDNT